MENIIQIRNSYATNSVNGSRSSGGLVGINESNNFFEIINSYAIGSVTGTGPEEGGLVGWRTSIVRNSYWNSETSGQSESEGGTSKTTVELQTGIANTISTDTTYYQWDSEHWYFGNANQYPAVVYSPGSSASLCKVPSEAQLASCAARVPADLNDADRAIICRDRLRQSDEEQPYCGALVPGQHLGLIHLELSDGVQLKPAFNPVVEGYQLVIDDGQTAFHITPTAYHRSDTVTLRAGNSEQVIADGTRSTALAIADYDTVIIAVRDAISDAVQEYELVIRGSSVPAGIITVSSIEVLEQLRTPPAECARSFGGCTYWLTRDLDFNDPASYRSGVVDTRWTSGAGWIPIGTDSDRFNGTLNGQGHTLSNLRINRPGSDAQSLFAYVGIAARIENIRLANFDINGASSGRCLSCI